MCRARVLVAVGCAAPTAVASNHGLARPEGELLPTIVIPHRIVLIQQRRGRASSATAPAAGLRATQEEGVEGEEEEEDACEGNKELGGPPMCVGLL